MAKLDLSIIDNYYEVINDTQKVAKEFITNFLKEHNNAVNLYDDEAHDYVGEEVVSVTYDGGNHPEYASNAFSNVERIYLDDKDNILLDIEDAARYPIGNCDYSEIIYLAEYLNRVQDLF